MNPNEIYRHFTGKSSSQYYELNRIKEFLKLATVQYQSYQKTFDHLVPSFGEILSEIQSNIMIVDLGHENNLNKKMLNGILAYIALNASDPVEELHQNADPKFTQYLNAWLDMNILSNKSLQNYSNVVKSIQTVLEEHRKDVIAVYNRYK